MHFKDWCASKKRVEGCFNRFSGRIVAVGDTFDYCRSSIITETPTQYWRRTKPWHKHIGNFLKGNHDAYFLDQVTHTYDKMHASIGPVLIFHGHQIYKGNNTQAELRYLKQFDQQPQKNSLVDLEDWTYMTFAKWFQPRKLFLETYVRSILTKLEKWNWLRNEHKWIIFGHTHLPFIKKVRWRGVERTVANTGSALKNNIFNPVYVKEINKCFVSDLHLGSSKSVLN